MKKPKTFSGFFAPYFSSCRPDTTRFVEVPISVQVPPSTVAKDMGISSFLGLMPHLFQIFKGSSSSMVGHIHR